MNLRLEENGLSARGPRRLFGKIKKAVNKVGSSKVALLTPYGIAYQAAKTAQGKSKLAKKAKAVKKAYVNKRTGKVYYTNEPVQVKAQKPISIPVYTPENPKYSPYEAGYTDYEVIDTSLEFGPAVPVAMNVLKNVAKSPAAKKLLSKVTGKSGAASSAVKSISAEAKRIQELEANNKLLKENNKALQEQNNSLNRQRYYYGGGGLVAGFALGKFLR